MATDSFINQLLAERETKVSVIEQLANTAAEEGRDLYETDVATIDNYRARVKAIDVQIDKVAGDLELADAVKSRIKHLDPQTLARDFMYRTAGEYLYDALHRNNDPDSAGRWAKFHRRVAEHMGTSAELTVPVAGGFEGLLISQSEGAVLNPRPEGRPLLSALGAKPAPGVSFFRPRIVDPNFTSGVGEQTLQKQELVSKAWDILNEPVNLKTYGGYINLAEQANVLIASAWDLVVSQMNARLENLSEVAVVTELAKTGETIALGATATSAEITAALGNASATVFTNTGRLPTWLAMGPAAYGRLIGVSDLAGRPMIPAVGAVNAWGSGSPDSFFGSLAGMRVVVTHAITDADMYVGNSYGLEVYERRLPVLSAVEPSLLGRQIAVATMLGFYAPITTEAGAGGTPPAERNGVVHIDWA